MAFVKVYVDYKHRRIGATNWIGAATTITTLTQQSESLLMQELRKRYPKEEIELKKIVWK